MFITIGETYKALLGSWARWVTAWAWLIIAISLGLTGASLFYLSQNIAVDTSTGDMLSEELDFRKFNKEMDAAFPQFSDTLLVVIDAQTLDLADSAAHQLAEKLRAQPDLYGDVYDLAGESYFQRNGLLYLDTDALYDLSDQLADSQPFLAALWRDPSLNGLFSLLAKALEFEQSGDAVPLQTGPFLEKIRTVGAHQLQNTYSDLSWRDVMQGEEGATGSKRRFLLVQPALNFGSLQPASDAMDGIRALVQALELTPLNGLHVRLTGSAALEQEELESVEEGMGLAGILSFVLVMALLVIGLRKGWLVFSCLVTLIIGLIWTATFAIVMLKALNLISVAFAVLFIGLSVDFGIHFALRYLEEINDGQATPDALAGTAKKVGGGLSLSAIGAAIAFYSFLPTDYNGLAELGLIAGTGMFIALFANLTVLPALLALRPLTAKGSSSAGNPTKSLQIGFNRRITSHARPIVWAFISVAVAACFTIPNVTFDFDPLNLKNRQTESMSTLIDLMADSRTSPYTIEILADTLEQGEAMAKQLALLDPVKSAETIADYVPEEQEDKLDVIMSTALFLAPAFATRQSSDLSDTPPKEALERFMAVLGENTSPQSSAELLEVLNKISTLEGGPEELQRRLLVHLPAQLGALKASLEAQPVVLDDLPESLRQRKITADGRVIVEVFPKYDVTDQQQLITFVNAVRSVAPRAIGSPVVILEAGRAILGAFYQAGALSVITIAVLLFFVLGNIRDVLLVFAPLVLAGLFTLAASVLFGLAFNFANVIVLPLLFGLGVAGAIHLVLRAGTDTSARESLSTSTPRAILFSALTTMGSFGSIALSAHPGTASMGILLTIAITLTLACTLIFLPALMTYTSKVKPNL